MQVHDHRITDVEKTLIFEEGMVLLQNLEKIDEISKNDIILQGNKESIGDRKVKIALNYQQKRY